MRVSTSLSDGEIVLLWEILTKLLSGSDPKLLVKNANFPRLMQSAQRLKARVNPDPSARPPIRPKSWRRRTEPLTPVDTKLATNEPQCIGCTEDSGPDPECPKCGPTTAT